MKAFSISGSYEDVRYVRQPFCIEMAAEDAESVKEKVLSTIGSKHKLKRTQICIKEIKELSADEITNHVVKYQIGE